MHGNAMSLMTEFCKKYSDKIKDSKVLEVGSQNINGTFKTLFGECGEYVGIDIFGGLCPYDCWRILPDGMHVLFEGSGMHAQDCRINCEDTIGVAIK